MSIAVNFLLAQNLFRSPDEDDVAAAASVSVDIIAIESIKKAIDIAKAGNIGGIPNIKVDFGEGTFSFSIMSADNLYDCLCKEIDERLELLKQHTS